MKQYLYLLLDLGSLSIPLLYSIFEQKFHFIKHFKKAVISIVIVAIFFLIWDAIFTAKGVWGFNETYHLPYKIAKMPIEEWLFFFCIPYACLFTHEVLKYYLPNFKLSLQLFKVISYTLIGIAGAFLIIHFGKLYSTVNFALFIVLMVFTLVKFPKTLQSYYPSFAVILIPFLIVNGILTGSFIEDQVVWYNNAENSGFRIGTIPFEDFFYAFSMLFSVQLIFNYLSKKECVGE